MDKNIGEHEFGGDENAEDVVDFDEDDEAGEVSSDDEYHGAIEMEGVEDVIDDSSCSFEEHKEPVFCINFNPINHALVATGGQDDIAYVWNSVSGEVHMKCTGHKDSVTQVSFSSDGTLLATGDMSGFIQVWHISTKELVWSFEIADLEWMDWHFGTKVLFASDVEGNVWMWRIPSGDCKTFSNSGVSASCCVLLPGGSLLASGYSNGVIKVWDLTSGACKLTISGNEGHDKHVTSLSVLQNSTDSNVLMSGSTDGTVHIYNFQTGKLLKTFDCKSGNPDMDADESECSVESVSLCSSRPLAAAATNQGEIFIYDLKSQTCTHRITNEACPFTRIQWHINSPLLYSADAAGVVSLWDGRTGESTAKFYGHVAEIHDLAVSKHGIIFATASEDGSAKVFSVAVEEAGA